MCLPGYEKSNSRFILVVKVSSYGMLQKKISLSCGLLFVLSLMSALSLDAAQAQTRRLQPARFQSFTAPSGAGLQPASGVHLNEGYERNKSNKSAPYNPGEPSLSNALVRWDNKKMPIKIWISPGLKLPEAPFDELTKVRPDQVFEMLRSPEQEPFVGMETVRDWTEETNYQVATGIEQWRQFENEGLFSFGFVDDPRQAHVLVFFVDNFKDSTGPGGNSVGGVTCAQLYPYEQAQKINIAQKPVVIELSTMVNYMPEKMIGSAAHEFGHALGIKEHSPYRDDIMYVNNVVNQLSPSDKSTIRFLYRSKPAFVM